MNSKQVNMLKVLTSVSFMVNRLSSCSPRFRILFGTSVAQIILGILPNLLQTATITCMITQGPCIDSRLPSLPRDPKH